MNLNDQLNEYMDKYDRVQKNQEEVRDTLREMADLVDGMVENTKKAKSHLFKAKILPNKANGKLIQKAAKRAKQSLERAEEFHDLLDKLEEKGPEIANYGNADLD